MIEVTCPECLKTRHLIRTVGGNTSVPCLLHRKVERHDVERAPRSPDDWFVFVVTGDDDAQLNGPWQALGDPSNDSFATARPSSAGEVVATVERFADIRGAYARMLGDGGKS